MKFQTDRFGDRELRVSDRDGDVVRVTMSAHHKPIIDVNCEATLLGRKKLRKFAKAILKELSK